jgi:hypothetical protein
MDVMITSHNILKFCRYLRLWEYMKFKVCWLRSGSKEHICYKQVNARQLMSVNKGCVFNMMPRNVITTLAGAPQHEKLYMNF